jgi:hypothetical protein
MAQNTRLTHAIFLHLIILTILEEPIPVAARSKA